MQPEFSIGILSAAVAMTNMPFRFVKISAAKTFNRCGAGETGIGVIQDEPAAGKAGNIMVSGVSLVELGGVVNGGDLVKSDASGKAVAAAANDPFVFGQAIEGGANGDFIHILLPGGNMARNA